MSAKKNGAAKKKPATRARSARTGKFVKADTARRHPSRTVVERIKPRAKG